MVDSSAVVDVVIGTPGTDELVSVLSAEPLCAPVVFYLGHLPTRSDGSLT
jgi:hypothetical protein